MAEPVWQFRLSDGNEPLFSVPVRTQGCQTFPNAHPWASHPIALDTELAAGRTSWFPARPGVVAGLSGSVSTKGAPMRITGRTKLAGIMGWPVSHSRSPALHNFWLDEHGIDGAYVPLPVQPEQLERALRALPA